MVRDEGKRLKPSFENCLGATLEFKNTTWTTPKVGKLDVIFSSCNTPLPEIISNSGRLSTFLISNKLSRLSPISPSLRFLVALHLLLCASHLNPSLFPRVPLSFAWELEVWNAMWRWADRQQSVAAAVCFGASVWVCARARVDPCACVRISHWGVPGRTLILAWAEVRPAPDGAIVLCHASIIHGEPEKVAECVCLFNN